MPTGPFTKEQAELMIVKAIQASEEKQEKRHKEYIENFTKLIWLLVTLIATGIGRLLFSIVDKHIQ